MLLAVMDGVKNSRGGYTEREISFDPIRRDFANLYMSLVDSSRPVDIIATEPATQAFWYLGSGKPKIWSLIAQPGCGTKLSSAITNAMQIKSPRKLASLVRSMRFSAPTWELIQNTNRCNAIISFLIARYFPGDLEESTIQRSLHQLSN
jgi:hypothetical protein